MSSSGNEKDLKVDIAISRLREREKKLLRKIEALEESRRRWKKKAEDLELKVEELEEALHQARMEESWLRERCDFSSDSP